MFGTGSGRILTSLTFEVTAHMVAYNGGQQLQLVAALVGAVQFVNWSFKKPVRLLSAGRYSVCS